MDKVIEMLEELYAIDPELKKHEAKLKKIALTMLKAAPKGELDKNFSSQLREQLIAKAYEIKQAKTKPAPAYNWYSLSFAGAGALVAGVIMWIVLPSFYPSTPVNQQVIPSVADLGFNSKISVHPAGEKAFGSLAMAPAGTQAAGLGSADAISSRSFASSATAPASAPATTKEAPVMATGMGGGGGGVGSKILPYEPTNYKFVYKGEGFEIPTTSLPVLKNVKNSDAGTKAGKLLSKISFGLFNINSFQNSKVSSISFSEDKPNGFMAMMNFDDESFSLYRNWLKWPQVNYDRQLTRADSIPDDQIVAMADDFANKYGMDMSAYGKPMVDNSWVRYQSADSQYFPDSVQVIYPLLYNGAEVLDESGNLSGPRINVNIRDRQPEGVWDLRTNDYLSSDYELENSKDKILEVAGRGGYNRGYFGEAKTVEVGIGQPEVRYVRIYQYQESQTNLLLVPALVFPVTQKPSENFYQDKVVVPLVKEFLQNTQPPITIMEKSVR